MKERTCWNVFMNSKIATASVLIIYFLVGTLFYKFYEDFTWPEAYYLAVDNGLRLGFTTVLRETNDRSKIFSIVFEFVGVAFLALLYTNVVRSNFFQTAQVRRNRIIVLSAITIVLIIIATFWSTYMVADWSVIDGIYFVFASFWFWGIVSMPTDTADSVLVVSFTGTIVGGMVVLVLYGLLSADVEISIEKYMLRMVAKQAFTSEELGIVQSLVINKNKQNQSHRSYGSEDDGEHHSPLAWANNKNNSGATNGTADGNASELDEHMVKHILLGRVLAMEDISIVYFHMRIQLLMVLAVLLVLSTLFYRYYDNSADWSQSLSFAISSLIGRVGYTSNDKDGFSEMVSVLFMLCGWICFGVITVSVTREFSLHTTGIRLNHTILLGSLCVGLVAVMTYLSMTNYQYETIDGLTLAVKIMICQGGTIPGFSDVWDYWLADVYSLVAIPLFLFFMAHLESEVDIGDSAGYMDNAIQTYFSAEDMGFLSIFHKTHDKTSASGIYQLHALLILRFREMRDMPQIVASVDREYGCAIKNGLVPNLTSRRVTSAIDSDEERAAATEIDSLLSN